VVLKFVLLVVVETKDALQAQQMADRNIPGVGERKRKAEAKVKEASKKVASSGSQTSTLKTTKGTKAKQINFVLVEGTKAVAAQKYVRPNSLK
jgi:hypothetical protein